MRLFLYMPVGNSEAVRVVLGLIAFASIIFGNLMALSQTNIKRLLGYPPSRILAICWWR